MKVNITHSISLDRIPFELSKRVAESKKDLENTIDWFDIIIRDLEDGTDPRIIFDHSDKIREKLADVDQALAEHTSILAEYQRATAELYLAKQEAVQATKEPPQPSEPHVNQELQADIVEATEELEDDEEEIDYEVIRKGLTEKEI